MTHIRTLSSLGAALLIALPGAALAHSGHGESSGFMAGLMHPLTGLDHLVAALLVGIWAAMSIGFGRRALLLPAAFVAFMLVGFAAAPLLSMTGVETVISASLIVLGACATMGLRAPMTLAATLIALFAFAHGLAHGSELGQHGGRWITAAGLVSATLMLHLVGLLFVKLASPLAARIAGALGLATGGVLLVLAT